MSQDTHFLPSAASFQAFLSLSIRSLGTSPHCLSFCSPLSRFLVLSTTLTFTTIHRLFRCQFLSAAPSPTASYVFSSLLNPLLSISWNMIYGGYCMDWCRNRLVNITAPISIIIIDFCEWTEAVLIAIVQQSTDSFEETQKAQMYWQVLHFTW